MKRPRRLNVHEIIESTLLYLDPDLHSWTREPGFKLDADHWRHFRKTKSYARDDCDLECSGDVHKFCIPIENITIAYIRPKRYCEVSDCILMQISTYRVRKDGRRVSTLSVIGLHFQHARGLQPIVTDIFDTITKILVSSKEPVRQDTYARRETYHCVPAQLDIITHTSQTATRDPSLRIDDVIAVPEEEEAHVQIEPLAIVDDDASSEAIVPHMPDKDKYVCATVALESLGMDSNLEKTRKHTFQQSLVISPGIRQQVDMATPRCGIGTQYFLDERSKHLSNSLLIDERNKDAQLDVFSVNFDRCDVMKCSRNLHTFIQGTQPSAKEVTSDVPYQIICKPYLLRSMSRFTKMFKSSYDVLRSIEPAWKNCEPFFTIIDDQRTVWDPDISKFKTLDLAINSLPSIPSALLSPTPNRFPHIVRTTKSRTRGCHSEALSKWTYCIIVNYEVLSGKGNHYNSTILTSQELFVISPEPFNATPHVSTTDFDLDFQHIAKINTDYVLVVQDRIRLTGMRFEDIATKTSSYNDLQISAQDVRARLQVVTLSAPNEVYIHDHVQVRSRPTFEDFIAYSHDDPTRLEFSQLQGPVVSIASETFIFHSPRLSGLESSFNVSSMKYKASDSIVDDTGQIIDEIHGGGRKETDEHNSLDGVRSNCLKSALFHDLHGTHAQPFYTHARNARVTYRSTSHRTVQRGHSFFRATEGSVHGSTVLARYFTES